MKKQMVLCLLLFIVSLWFGSLVASLSWGTNHIIKLNHDPIPRINNILIITNILMFLGYLAFIIATVFATLKKRWLLFTLLILYCAYFIFGAIIYNWNADTIRITYPINYSQEIIWVKIHSFFAVLLLISLVVLLVLNIKDTIKKHGDIKEVK